MVRCVQPLVKQLLSLNVRNLSTAAQTVQIPDEPIQLFRTSENNPSNHRKEHLNRLYTVPTDDYKMLFTHGGLHNQWQNQVKTFNECSILIRQPAVEIFSYLRQTDYSRPANKYVIYGELGTGKSTTLAHVLHYAYVNRNVIVHVPWVVNWYRYPKEITNSPTKEGIFDLPIDAASWLVHFKTQNVSLLHKKDLVVTNTYEWTSRESTPKGTPIIEMIEFGINRVKFACNVVIALMDELKAASNEGKCSLLVAIDGFNGFFSDYTRIRNDEKKFVGTDKISLTEAFLNITKPDFRNGAVVLTVDKLCTKSRRESNFPRYLLSEPGFNHLDPFIPIAVDKYSIDEFHTIIDYYLNRKWIRDINPDGIRELELLSNYNPYKLMEYCKPL